MTTDDRFLYLMQRFPGDWGAGRRWLHRRLHLRHGNAVKATLFGKEAVFHLDNTSEYKFLMSPWVYNRREIDFLLAGLQTEVPVFVDIGANGGIFSFAIASRLKKPSQILAVEPNPILCERLATNLVEKNDFSGMGVDIIIEQTALGDDPGMIWLDTSTGLGTARVTASEGESGHWVSLKTLLEVCKKNRITKIDALKIDVEGYEETVLSTFFRDAPEALRPRRVVIESITDDSADLLTMFTDLGYRKVAKTRNNILWKYQS